MPPFGVCAVPLTIALWPSRSPIFCATSRPTMSDEPPAVNGTIMLMLFSG